MKCRPTFTAFMCMIALSALRLSAQDAVLQDAGVSDGALPLQNDAVEIQAAPPVDPSGFLNPLVEREWVVLDNEGKIQGTYSVLTPDGESRGLGGVSINLGRNGVVIQSAVTDPNGRFVFSGVGVGTYALVAKAPNSLAAFALHILPAGSSARLDSNVAVLGTSFSGPAMGEIFRTHVVPGEASPGYYPELQADPYGDARRFNENATVQLTAGGMLMGRVSRPNGFGNSDLSGNVVHILAAGRVVGHVPTSPDGQFQVAGLAPGGYDFIIAGKDGVAAGSFRAVAGPGVVKNADAESQLVNAVNNQAEGDGLNVELVAPNDFMAGQPEFLPPPEEELGMAPIPGGGFAGPGFGGGMGGGGGGAGGLGGLGGLLGIAGLAAGIAALASDNNNNFPPIVSPIQ